MKKKTFLVLGHMRHGKDTFCEILRDKYDIVFYPSSIAIAGYIRENHLQDQRYLTDMECFEDRVNHRETWFSAIAEYNKDDLCAHIKNNILKDDGQIYCGIRRKAEFDEAMRQNLFDYVVWVDALDRLPPEDRKSFDVDFDESFHRIDNNGTLEEFESNIDAFMESIL